MRRSSAIGLENMPFARFLAPLVDAYLRAISHKYITDTDTVAEILRELSRSVPDGFVERRRPTNEDLQRRSMFLEFIPDLARNDGPPTERDRLRLLQRQLAARGDHDQQAKRRYQIQEYVDFWEAAIPGALRLSFGTLGYGTFQEVLDELSELPLQVPLDDRNHHSLKRDHACCLRRPPKRQGPRKREQGGAGRRHRHAVPTLRARRDRRAV